MRVVCCLLSPHVVKSVWVERELVYALNNSRYEDRIIPVLYEPCHPSALSWERQGFQSSADARAISPRITTSKPCPWIASGFGIWDTEVAVLCQPTLLPASDLEAGEGHRPHSGLEAGQGFSDDVVGVAGANQGTAAVEVDPLQNQGLP